MHQTEFLRLKHEVCQLLDCLKSKCVLKVMNSRLSEENEATFVLSTLNLEKKERINEKSKWFYLD